LEDNRIKSALEIALEKAAQMPSLTHEELVKQKEREFKPRGEAIANKYMGNALRGADLVTELRRYKGEEGETVKKAFLSTLFESIRLNDVEKSRRAISGIQTVEKEVSLKEIDRELEEVFNEYRQEEKQRALVYEGLEREQLQKLGISGSAVKPNLEESKNWQQELAGLKLIYESRLNKLKENIAHLIRI